MNLVPILPDYLSQLDEASIQNNLDNLQENVKYKNLYLHYVSTMFGSQSAIAINETLPDNLFHFDVVNDKLWNNNKLNEENSSVGFLLAIKALVQLIATPFVTSSINSYGYRIPAVFGTFGLFVASLTFALGKNYFLLFLARAIQGVASACISVCGMSIIAQVNYFELEINCFFTYRYIFSLAFISKSFIQRRKKEVKYSVSYLVVWH